MRTESRGGRAEPMSSAREGGPAPEEAILVRGYFILFYLVGEKGQSPGEGKARWQARLQVGPPGPRQSPC